MPTLTHSRRRRAVWPLRSACGSAVALTLAGLAACATGTTPGEGERRVIGDAEHASVQGDRLDALPLAVIHCARYGRSARFARAEGDRSVFRCVAKP